MKYIISFVNFLNYSSKWLSEESKKLITNLSGKSSRSKDLSYMSDEEIQPENIFMSYTLIFAYILFLSLYWIGNKIINFFAYFLGDTKKCLDSNETITQENTSEFSTVINHLDKTKIIEPIDPKYTAEDLINKMLFEISSDIGCGRHANAQKTMSFILKQDEITLNAFVSAYAKMLYHLNPKMFYLTLLLFKKCRNKLAIQKMNELIETHSFCFSLKNVVSAIKFLDSDLVVGDNKILLILYYTGQYEKMRHLIKSGYKPHNLKCKTVVHFVDSIDGDTSDSFFNYLSFYPTDEQYGKQLSDLIYKNLN